MTATSTPKPWRMSSLSEIRKSLTDALGGPTRAERALVAAVAARTAAETDQRLVAAFVGTAPSSVVGTPTRGDQAAPGDGLRDLPGAAIPTVPPQSARAYIINDDERLVQYSTNYADRQFWLRATGIDDGGAVLEHGDIRLLADKLAAAIGCRVVTGLGL